MKRRNLIKSLVGLPIWMKIDIDFTSVFSIPKSNRHPQWKHSVCRWCFREFGLPELVLQVKEIGIDSIELLDIDEIRYVTRQGLECAIANGSPLMITKGFNKAIYHKQLLDDYSFLIPRIADLGVKQIICFSGNREGQSDESGLEQCAIGLGPIVKMAEKYNVSIVMELLNSKIDHFDYMCDSTEWGVQLVDKVGSENFKLLYDIYHMQIMEGDIINTINKYKDYISHYHTAGVPGRNEIDDSQELNYKAIVEAITAYGYTGYIAQEFIPKNSRPFESLKNAIEICKI